MEKEYKIRGIEKIIDKSNKKDLAKFFNTKEDKNFETLLTNYFKTINVPNGLEIAGYESENYEDIKNGINSYYDDIYKKYASDGKSAISIDCNISNKDIEEIYFYIDEPIRNDVLGNIWTIQLQLGVVSTLGYTMGRGFYESHKDEINKFIEKYKNITDQENDFQTYLKNYFDSKLSGKKVREDEEDYYDLERELAEDKKERMAGVENLITKLTGGKTIDNVTLKELEQIKQGLIDRKEKVMKAFAVKFGTKDNEQEK